MMAGFQAEENLTGRAKKMCEKLWTLSKNFSSVLRHDFHGKEAGIGHELYKKGR